MILILRNCSILNAKLRSKLKWRWKKWDRIEGLVESRYKFEIYNINVSFLVFRFIGRGIGGVLAYAGLTCMSKEYLLKTCAIVAILFCILFLVIHYWCLKPIPTGKKYNVEKQTSQGNSNNLLHNTRCNLYVSIISQFLVFVFSAPSGKYKPVKLIGKKGIPEDEKDTDEL